MNLIHTHVIYIHHVMGEYDSQIRLALTVNGFKSHVVGRFMRY